MTRDITGQGIGRELGGWKDEMVAAGKKVASEHWELGGWEDVMVGAGKKVVV